MRRAVLPIALATAAFTAAAHAEPARLNLTPAHGHAATQGGGDTGQVRRG